MQKNGETRTVQELCMGAAIAAVYVALTLALAPISFGPIQFRVSEMLCVLPAFTPAAIPGLAIGCLLANLLAGAMLPDVVFGTLATLLGAIGSYQLCRGLRAQGSGTAEEQKYTAGRTGIGAYSLWLCAALPPIVSNAVIIPLVLKYAYHMGDAVWFMVLTVGAGEVLAVGVLGGILLRVLQRYRGLLFERQSA